ncbi:MAG: WbuC family cupin fold metalloprotein, partial [Burkholderiaceae bacterium]
MDHKHLTKTELDALSAAAAASPRLRMHRNFHPDHSAPVQRLAIAMEPGTYVRPHRHSHTWELLLILRGELELVLFDPAGEQVTGRVRLSAEANQVFEMPANTWHSVLSRQPGTVVFEVKQGPYQALPASDVAAGSPAEGEAAVAGFMSFLDHAQTGDRW